MRKTVGKPRIQCSDKIELVECLQVQFMLKSGRLCPEGPENCCDACRGSHGGEYDREECGGQFEGQEFDAK